MGKRENFWEDKVREGLEFGKVEEESVEMDIDMDMDEIGRGRRRKRDLVRECGERVLS